jgi:hypothetical protein
MWLHRGSLLLLLQLTVSCSASPSPPPIILLTETGECGSAECASACSATGSDCAVGTASCELGSQLAERAVSWLVARLRQLSLTAAKIGKIGILDHAAGLDSPFSCDRTQNQHSGILI